MRFSFGLALGAAALIVALAAGRGLAHEGHDHGDQPPPAPASAAPRGEATSERFEVVAVARGTELVVYLDRFATNEPVVDARIEIETPDGPATATPAAAAYRVDAKWLAKPGRADLIFTVTAEGATDILPLSLEVPAAAASKSADAHASFVERARNLAQPAILLAVGFGFLLGLATMALRRRRKVSALLLALCALALVPGKSIAHEGEDHGEQKGQASQTARELAQRFPDGTVFVPKSVQRIFGIRTALTGTGTFRRALELPGRIIPDPNASGYVQAAVGGRLSPPPGGFPRLGTPVKAGDVLAYVTPPLQAIDLSDMRQRQGELDQQIAIVDRRVGRYEMLVPSGAATRTQLDESRLELQGLRDRRGALDQSRQVPEALVAPVAGVVADGTPVAGQIAQTNAIVFQIVDPLRLWVEALSFDPVAGAESASAITASGRNLALVHRGSGLADRSQSIAVHFAVEGAIDGIRAGQLVTVFVSTSEQKQGVALPRTSLVRGANGQDFVYEHVAAERFVPRPVRVEPLDGERVLVTAGIDAGRRIAVQGAELLEHVR